MLHPLSCPEKDELFFSQRVFIYHVCRCTNTSILVTCFKKNILILSIIWIVKYPLVLYNLSHYSNYIWTFIFSKFVTELIS